MCGIGRGLDTHQCNRTDNSEIDPYTYVQLIFDKGRKAIQWSKESPFKNVTEQLDTRIARQMMNLNLCLTPYTKTNSKGIRNLNVKYKTIKLLGKYITGLLCKE